MELTTHTAKGVDKLTRYGWSVKDQPGELRMLHKDVLVVDVTYQRDVIAQKVTAITGAWSYMACGALTVAERNGTFYVIDGGHRLAAAKRRSDITHLPCVVFQTAGVKEEARGFLDVNTGRKPVNAVVKHKALLAAGDETALFVQKLCERHGLVPQYTATAAGTIRCVSWLVTRAREDREALARVLAIAAELSAREAVPVAEKLLDGLWYVHKKCGAGLDDKRLMTRIREKKASELVEGANKAAAYYAHGGGAVFAEGMLNVLNKGLQRKFTMGEAA